MTDYKATSEQWAQVEAWMAIESEYSACVLELRARIEALEAGQRPASKVYEISKPLKLTAKQQQELNALLQPVTSQPSPNSSQIGSSLVERVGAAIFEQCEKNTGNEAEARAAIREVAAWMRENEVGYNAVRWIEQEIDQ
jgi:hypothetical protein